MAAYTSALINPNRIKTQTFEIAVSEKNSQINFTAVSSHPKTLLSFDNQHGVHVRKRNDNDRNAIYFYAIKLDSLTII